MAEHEHPPGGDDSECAEGACKRATVWFARFAAIGLLLCAAVNAVVDPLAQWGSPLGLEPALIRGDQQVVERLRQHKAPVEALVLGSSHAFCLRSEDISAATGLDALNAAGAGARIETMYATIGYVSATSGHWPRLLLIAVDTASFCGELDLNVALSEGPGEYVPYTLSLLQRIALRGRAVRQLFDIDTVRASLRSLQRWRGCVAQDQQEKALQAAGGQGPTVRAAALDRRMADSRTRRRSEDYGERYLDRSLDPRRVRWFREMVTSALAHDARVIVFTTPLHPLVDAACRKRSNYEPLLARTWALLQELQGEDPRMTAVDCSTIDKYGGRREWFVDGVHGTRENGQALIRHCLRRAGWERDASPTGDGSAAAPEPAG